MSKAMAGKLTASTLGKYTFHIHRDLKQPKILPWTRVRVQHCQNSTCSVWGNPLVQQLFRNCWCSPIPWVKNPRFYPADAQNDTSPGNIVNWRVFSGIVEISFITLGQTLLRSVCVTLIKACVERRGIKKDEQREFYWLDQETELGFAAITFNTLQNSDRT